MEIRDSSTVLQQITQLLMEADRLVKEGNLAAASEKIKQARAQDPQHLYAIAYEERVRGLIQAREKSHGNGLHKTAAGVREPLHIPYQRSGQVNAPVNGQVAAASTPTVSGVPERKIPAVIEGKQVMATLNESQRQFQQKKFEAFLLHAQNYFHRGEYNYALNEIARIYLFDPLNKVAHALEEQVRRAIALQSAGAMAAKSQVIVDREKNEQLTKETMEQRRREAIAQKMDAIISRASSFIEKKEYKRALEEISRAYILDPEHAQLPILEEKIYNAELKLWTPVDVQLPAAGTPSPQKGNTTLEKETVQQKEADLQKEAVVQKEKISYRHQKTGPTQFIHRVAELLTANQLEEALNEVVSSIVTDPFNERMLKLERAIIEAQHKQLAERQKQCKEIVEAISL